MKRNICLFLTFCLLCGCTNSSPTHTALSDEGASSNIIAPLDDLLVGFEDFDLEKVDLSELPTEVETDPWVWEPGIHLVTSIPEADIALYAPLGHGDARGVLVRRGDQLYKFDWTFSRYLFHAAWADYDQDKEKELAVGICTLQGLQLFHEDLHIIEFEPNDQARDHLLLEKLYQEDLTQQLQCEMDAEENRVTVRMGEDAAVSFMPTQPVPKTLQAGDGIQPINDMVFYSFEGSNITGTYGVAINCQEWQGYGFREDRASVVADVAWDGEEFKLRFYHLDLSVK